MPKLTLEDHTSKACSEELLLGSSIFKVQLTTHSSSSSKKSSQSNITLTTAAAHGRLSGIHPRNICFLGPTRVAIQTASAIFAQLMAESRYLLQRPPLPPSKLPLPMGDLDTPSNTWLTGSP